MATVILGLVALILAYVHFGWFDRDIVLATAVFVFFACSVLMAFRWQAATEGVLTALARGPFEEVAGRIRRFLIRLREAVCNRFIFATSVALSIIIQIFGMVLVVWCLARSLEIDVPLYFHFVAVPVITLLTLVPVSVNGLGVREAAFVFFYTKMAVETDEAISLSLSLTMILTLFSLLGGFFLQFPRLYGSGRMSDETADSPCGKRRWSPKKVLPPDI